MWHLLNSDLEFNILPAPPPPPPSNPDGFPNLSVESSPMVAHHFKDELWVLPFVHRGLMSCHVTQLLLSSHSSPVLQGTFLDAAGGFTYIKARGTLCWILELTLVQGSRVALN